MAVSIRTALLVLSLFVIAACSGDDSAGSESATTDLGSTTTTPTGSDPGLRATTAPTSSSAAASSSTTSSSTTSSTAADSFTSSSAAAGSTETAVTRPPSTAAAGSVLEPAGIGTFATPSGNILCVLSESTASCWISDKQWTIDQPDDPQCAESDWGNVIDLSATGVVWPCYTDFGFEPDAAALAYGDAMVVGEFRCDSARSGVTCRNGSGQGFTLARAGVQIF